MAHKIVVGNEKGGAGKSTVSMHVATALARIGHSVGVVDLDLRQKTFGRYMHNRLSTRQTIKGLHQLFRSNSRLRGWNNANNAFVFNRGVTVNV